MEPVDRLERFDDAVSRRDLHPHGGPQLRHHRRGLDAVTDHVADDQDQPIPEGNRIEPVASGGGVLGGDQVFRRDVGAGNDRHRRGQ